MGTRDLRSGRGLANVAFAACLAASLAACGGGRSYSGGGDYGSGAGGAYKVGKPYQVAGIWYYPREDEHYDATGIGSWYGPNFHGKRTANGEMFDQNAVTAAHPTLPMPVLVRVTNLENGRSVIVRVNDRGPFVAGREIDLSRRAAEILGYDRKGTAKVRVQFVSRAPLPGQPNLGATYAGSPSGVGETFVAPKADIDEDEKQLTPMPVVAGGGAIATTSLDAPSGITSAPAPIVSSLPAPIAPGPAPVMQPPPTKAVVQQVPVPPVTGIYVQAGAFQSVQNAEVVKAQLTGYGNVQISKTMVQGTPYYRVRIGPLPDVPSADASLKAIVQGGHPGARIVVE